jgi:hypothetical protein
VSQARNDDANRQLVDENDPDRSSSRYSPTSRHKKIDRVPNIWRPGDTPSTWPYADETKAIMSPARCDALTLRSSPGGVGDGGCNYCINSHTAAQKQLDTKASARCWLWSGCSIREPPADAYQIGDILPKEE